jgi:polyisoprenoid-binding protein YceI
MSTSVSPNVGITTWNIDPAHTQAEFSVKHLMIATVRGHFGNVTGTVTIQNDDATTAKIDVSIDAKSIDTRDEKRDAHLRSPDFFNVDKYPTITFKSTKVERGGDGFRVTGDLTISGVTRPVTLDVEDQGRARDPWGNEKAAFSATTKVKRSEFGLTWNVALEAGGVLVGDDIKISIDAQLAKQQG